MPGHLLAKHGVLHGPSPKMHKCDFCEYSSSVRSNVVKHIQGNHPSENMETYSCEKCDKVFTVFAHLTRHVQEVHLNVRDHKCEHCDSRFKRKDKLALHMAAIHKINPIWHHCDECSWKSLQKGHLDEHKLQWHADASRNCKICLEEKCERLFRVTDSHGNVLYACDVCRGKINPLDERPEHSTAEQRKEHRWRNVLLKKLDNSFLLAQDRSLKAIGGCSKKRPDRIDAAPGTPGVGEIHECDEHQHLWSSSSYKCEEARIRELSLELIEANKGDTIVLVFRTNPDGYTPPVGKKKLTETERFELHASLVNKLCAKYAEILPKLHDAGFLMVHFYIGYNEDNGQIVENCGPVFHVSDEKDIDAIVDTLQN